MKRVKPTSHRALQSFLQAVLDGNEKYAHLPRPHLQSDTVQQVATLLAEYQMIHQLATQHRAERKATYQAMRNQIKLLRGQLESLWAQVRAYVQSQQTPAELYSFYGLSAQGQIAHPPKNRSGWLGLAQEVLAGCQAAQQHPEYPQFDASSLSYALATAQETHRQLKQVVKETHTVIARRQEIRYEANLLYREVASELRRALMRHSPVYQREIMRKYGYVFESEANSSGKHREESGAEPSEVATDETIRERAGEKTGEFAPDSTVHSTPDGAAAWEESFSTEPLDSAFASTNGSRADR